jgi:hypothetical protein
MRPEPSLLPVLARLVAAGLSLVVTAALSLAVILGFTGGPLPLS